VSNIERKIKRRQELQIRKASSKSMRAMEKALNSMPRSCSNCYKGFDPKSPGALDTWNVTVGPSGMTLMCPICVASSSVQSQTQS